MARVDLVVIDPQNSFMGNDDGSAYMVKLDNKKLSASLPVPGAVSDMRRLAKMVDRVVGRINRIHVSLDTHHVIDVSHPGMWRNAQGEMPPPFTMISTEDIENGIWTPHDPTLRQYMIDYTKELKRKGNFPLIVWTEHCLIGTWGHNVQIDVANALHRWQRATSTNVNFILKGMNYLTEHYGALEAEVPTSDPGTALNRRFLNTISPADIIGVAGEAETHCVMATVKQIANNIGEENFKKFHILTDCMSPIPAQPDGPDYPTISKNFFADMAARGMTLTTSTEFLN